MNAVPDLERRLVDLLVGREGHFLLESGLHGERWLDLDRLFAVPRDLAPFIAALAAPIDRHRVEVVCGPLTGGAFVAHRIALDLALDFAWTERCPAAAKPGLFGARYRLPGSLARRLRGRRVALVDDVVSAGSSLRATHAALVRAGALPVVVGALLATGTRGVDHFAALGLPVETVARTASDSWAPEHCPLCLAGLPLEDATTLD